MESPSLSNDYKNEYRNIPDVPVFTESDRIQPRQVETGVQRGTTQTIMNTDGSYVTFGVIPDNSGQLGIAYFNAQNQLIAKNTGQTDYKYDVTTGRNYYQNGLLPDGSYGLVITKAPYSVSDAVV